MTSYKIFMTLDPPPPSHRYWPAEANHGGGRDSDTWPVKEDLLRTRKGGQNETKGDWEHWLNKGVKKKKH